MKKEMNQMDVKAFRKLCEGYVFQKEWLSHLEANHPWLQVHGLQEAWAYYDQPQKNEIARQYDLLTRQTQAVETILEKIEVRCGIDARLLLEEQFIRKEKQIAVAKKYGYSLRTLQRRNLLWIREGYRP